MNLKHIQRYIVLGAALLALGSIGAVNAASGAPAPENGVAVAPTVKFKVVSRGIMAETAAINADGTVGSCYNCNPATTTRLGTGTYQVAFKGGSVAMKKGVARWVQPDTLTAGNTQVWCDTADRAGVAAAVWVNCQNHSGPADTAFFLFVTK
ncbi:MAG TPA: hypothetical protein VLT90_00110 [Terriglobales bacterium]|nr:hypothetical protein [Terriglobales bacterium]